MIAVLTICYNEAEWIRQQIRQFKPFGFHHLVLVSALPWHGTPVEDDGTADIARREGAEVIVGNWPSEHEQRNYGLALLKDYDWVITLDADEFYTQGDWEKLLKQLSTSPYPAAFSTNMLTYWKTPEYRFDPGDKNSPAVAVRPMKAMYYDKRQLRNFYDVSPLSSMEPIELPMWHMSWVKSDRKVAEKINSFEHFDIIRPGWYEDIWLQWTPEKASQLLNIRPYGHEVSRAIYDPAPKEIRDLYHSY